MIETAEAPVNARYTEYRAKPHPRTTEEIRIRKTENPGQAKTLSLLASTLPEMLSIPKNPCPVGGLVPWMGGLWPIAGRRPHPVLIWLYTIHEKRKDMGLVIWANTSQEDVVREMDAFARFKPGDRLSIGSWNTRRVMARKWNFETGTMTYTIEGNRDGKEWVMDQAQLLARINAADEQAA